MLTTLLIALAAQALSDAPPPSGPSEHSGRRQVFIAPSGEPFRVYGNVPYPVADWFARADADHDGKLTEAEFTADFMSFFARLDGDHDGIIDAAELERYEAATPELHSGVLAGGWSGGDPGTDEDEKPRARKLGSYMGANDPQGGGRFDLLRIPEPVASMDTDLKGRITRRQAQDAAEYRFSLLDGQHHGYLALADLPETFAQSHRGGLAKHGRGGGGGQGGHPRGGQDAPAPSN